jgi:hypothetical protein
MLVVGIRCANDKLDWAVVDGAQRSVTSAIVHRQVMFPAGDRGELLAVDGAQRSVWWSTNETLNNSSDREHPPCTVKEEAADRFALTGG